MLMPVSNRKKILVRILKRGQQVFFFVGVKPLYLIGYWQNPRKSVNYNLAILFVTPTQGARNPTKRFFFDVGV